MRAWATTWIFLRRRKAGQGQPAANVGEPAGISSPSSGKRTPISCCYRRWTAIRTVVTESGRWIRCAQPFPGYVLSFAYNYRAWWVPIPLRSPMGRVGSGLVTLSRVVPLQCSTGAVSVGLPFPVRLFNLKRCLLALQFRTAGGDTMLIGNTHNTAYDAGGMRDAEMRFLGGMLRRDAARGVVSVVGGDWNQYPPGYTPSPEELSNEFFVPQAVDSQVFGPGFRFAYDDSAPSLRYLDAPWTPVPEDGNPGSGRRRR